MREKPDIVKMLKEEEKLGKLQGRAQNKYEKLEMSEESFENVPGETIGFAEDDDMKKRETVGDTADYEKMGEKLRLFFHSTESSTDGMAMGDLEGKITYVNKAFIRMFGYSRKELVGKEIRFIYPMDQLPNLEEALKATMEKGGWTGELLGKRKNGEIFPMAVSASRVADDEGKVIAHMASHRDITERKKAEMKLIEREKELRFVTESSLDTIFALTKTGKITYINPSSKELFGFEPNEMIGTSFTKYVTKGELPKYWKALRDVLFHKKIPGFETYIKNRNGNLIPVEINGQTVERDGKLVAQGTIRDITERKKAEGKIKYLKEYSESILESNPNPIMVVKGNQIEYVNKSFISVFGKTKNDYISKELKEAIPVEVISAFEELLQEYDKIRELEIKGKSFSVSSFVVKKAEEEEERRGIILQNITERKKAMDEIENAKQELEAKNQELKNTINYADRISLETKNALTELDQIFNSTADGMLVIDKYFHILKMNDTFTTMFGISKAEVVGRKCYEVLNEPSCHSKLCPMKRMLDGTERVEFETEIEHTNGTKIPCNLTATSFKGADGEIIGIIENFKDITEWKKAEEKIKQQNIELEKLNALKSVFLNITSHELRTPMSSIKGYIQMLLRRTFGEISDEQKSALEVILRNTNRLDHLIQDILDISRIESGTMKFIPEKTNLQKMLNEIAETMTSSAGLKEIELNTDIKKGLPDLFIDQERIKQVIINLLNNAIKFSPDGSAINIRAKKEQNSILFEIQDFGRGIPLGKQEKIFDTFYQVDSSKDTKFGGAGLGLAISQGIAIAHGGKIWVESKGIPGEGSTFRFTLPVKSVKDIESRFKKVDVFRLEKKEE